ncbi:MAG: hypothetical protein JXR05_10720 [Flavobacteriaceae bacterium]
MKLKQVNTAFFITTGISVLIFVYLVFLGYDEIRTVKDIIKIIASVLFPIPLLFFVRFILIEHFMPTNSDEYKLESQKPATILLIMTVVISIGVMQLLELTMNQKLEDNLIFAHLVNSTSVSAYVLNFLVYNNLKANGILSGVLISLGIHVFFLS